MFRLTFRLTFRIAALGAAAGETRVAHPPKGMVDDQPDWSPDGKLIAFLRCFVDGARGVHVMNADGGGLRRLIAACKVGPPKCEDDANVTFLPEGRHVAFTAANR